MPKLVRCFLFSVFILVISESMSSEVIFDLSNVKKDDTYTDVLSTMVNTDIKEEIIISVKKVPSTIYYFIIQAHSFSNNVTLSYFPELIKNSFLVGTNIGLVQLNDDLSNFTFYLWKKNEDVNFISNVLISVTLYQKQDPIPGGCNLSFDTEIAPYQLISYTNDLVKVDAQPPSVLSHACEENLGEVEIYQLYLKERDLSEETYFSGIKRMLSVNSIRRNGWKVNGKNNGFNQYRNYFSAYPGTAAIYSIIAVYKNRSAAYVPSVSYACNPKFHENCLTGSTYLNVTYAIALLWSLITIFYGNLFFKVLVVVFKVVILTGIFTAVVFNHFNDFELSEHYAVFAHFSFGLSLGIFWLTLWCYSGRLLSILAMFLVVLLNGMLIASFVFYIFLGDKHPFQSNGNYWTTFLTILFSYVLYEAVSLVCIAGAIQISGLLGAFVNVLALDYFINSYLRYMVINVFRRIVVDNFELAVIHPIIQEKEITLMCFCLLLFLSGLIYQFYLNRSSAREIFIGSISETTPLLG